MRRQLRLQRFARRRRQTARQVSLWPLSICQTQCVVIEEALILTLKIAA